MNKITEIKSNSNQLIKYIKKLKRKRNRWQEEKFIIEGSKMIEEALEAKEEISHIIFSEEVRDREDYRLLLQGVDISTNIVQVSRGIFEEISDTESPQGIMALVSFGVRDIRDILEKKKKNLIFLDSLQDPGNLGTIIRTADAFKIDGIIIGENTVDPYNEKVVRATMGSIFRLPIYVCEDNESFIKEARDLGYKLFSTDLKGQALYLEEFSPHNIIIIGNESKGVSNSLSQLVDSRIKIPMPGEAESLNAGVAASIIMYEAMKV